MAGIVYRSDSLGLVWCEVRVRDLYSWNENYVFAKWCGDLD
ncbi:Hypothetical protein ETEE_2568 [Edwardsiella anguillarum ET080813]|uniref:Uncharacterized protein n=1 Tax=Edwardsiella anguillarum ET080813 TaxID=667120 RepID=A0A076LKL3_9GAMM|nr:Hypothetical protein ETEE_2568 [Edwardsiella anguillarum ET080813]